MCVNAAESNYLVILWVSVLGLTWGSPILRGGEPLPEPCPLERLSVTTAASARSSFDLDFPVASVNRRFLWPDSV